MTYTSMPPRTKPMARGKGLVTRTPLVSVTPLRSRTPLARTAPLREAAPHTIARGQSTSHPFPPAVCLLIDARDSDGSGALPVRLCQWCGTSRNPQRHHRRGKNKGGSQDRTCTQCACNGLTLCGPGGNDCHAWAHAHPVKARKAGLIVSQAVDEPGTVGVVLGGTEGGTTRWWPSCTGHWCSTRARTGQHADGFPGLKNSGEAAWPAPS